MNEGAVAAVSARQRETLLLEYTRELWERRDGRRAAWLHLSRLDAAHRRDRHVRVVASGFGALVVSRAAQLFVLADADIVLVYEGGSHEQVRAEVERILFLFGDDPTIADDTSHTRFVTWYDIEREYEAFLADVRAHIDGRPAPIEPTAIPPVPPGLVRRQQSGEVMTPATLERIERVLATADLSSLMRRQTACAVTPSLNVTPRFTELFVSIAELRDTVLPDGNLAGNPWLFRQLTQTLDRRVLSYLTTDPFRFDGTGISVNVNVSTLVNDAFTALERGLAGAGPSSVAFEVQPVDVFADITSFLFARDFAHQRGFRIYLDGIRWRDLEVVRAARLEVDLVKVLWDATLLDPTGPARSAVKRLAGELGSDRVVLCRIDSRDAVGAGHAMGLRVFQGYFVDGLLREDARRRHLQRLKQPRLRDT